MSRAGAQAPDPAGRAAALLDARAAALAARPAARVRPVETRAFLVCACGPERYGLPLAAVAGITPERPCTALPGAPPGLRGIAAMAGTIVSVLDLAACLGLSPEAEGGGHLVRLRGGETPLVLVVGRALGIARIDAALVRSGPDALGSGPHLGYAPPGADTGREVGEGFALLDLPALVARFAPRPPSPQMPEP